MSHNTPKQDSVFQKRAEGSLFNKGVTSSQLFSLKSPENLLDYSCREDFLDSYPFARLLLDKGLKSSTLVSMLKCGTFTGDYLRVSCACSSRVGIIRHKCSSRTCQFCSKRRKNRLVRRYTRFLSNLVTNQLYSLKLFTISPKNYISYDEGSEHIRKSLSKLWRRKYFKERVQGGIYVLETKTLNKRGEFKGWNCHVHILVYSRFLNNRLYGDCSRCKKRVWIKKNKFSDTFYCSNRSCNSVVSWNGEDSFLTREVKKVFSRDVTIDVQSVSSSVGALSYCLKYISSNKDDFACESDFADYIVKTHGRRLVSTFGVCYSARFSYDKPVCRFCKVSFVVEMFLNSPPPDLENPPPV